MERDLKDLKGRMKKAEKERERVERELQDPMEVM